MSTRHPSFFQLDRLACGTCTPEAIRAHVESCDHCAAYLARLKEAESVPGWARQLGSSTPAVRRMPRRRLWAAGLTSAITLAALLIVIRNTAKNGAGLFTTTKGSPSVGLYIKQGNRISLWNGQSAVSPGDKLRLKIVPDGYRYVTVFAESAGDATRKYDLLYRGWISPEKEMMLPTAWQVDTDPNPEALLIAMSDGPIDISIIEQDRRGLAAQGIWITRLTIRKEVR